MKSVYTSLLFALALLCTSCYENDVFLAEPDVELQDENIITPTELAGESSIVMSNMFADMMKAVSLSSEVGFGYEEQIAEVRSGCPTTHLASDGVYPDTLFLNFDNCNPSAVFDQTFNGAVMFILNGALDDPTVCPLFSIKKSPAIPDFLLMLGNSNKAYDVDVTNSVDFCLQSDNGSSLKYTYTLNGGVNLNVGTPGLVFTGGGFNTVLNPTGTTCYPDGMEGCVTLISNNKDDSTKPETFIDNTYWVSAKPTIIECKFQDGRVERFCIATNPEGISYNLRCGCPETGFLYIDSPATGDCDNIIGSNSFWDYGFIQNPNVGSCENSALNPDNVVTRIPCGQSF